MRLCSFPVGSPVSRKVRGDISGESFFRRNVVMDLVGSVLFSVVFVFVGAIHVSIGVVIGVSISISIGFLIVVFVVHGGEVVAVISD